MGKKKLVSTSLIALLLAVGAGSYWYLNQSPPPPLASHIASESRDSLPPSEEALPAVQPTLAPEPDAQTAAAEPQPSGTVDEETAASDSEMSVENSDALVGFAHDLSELMEHAMDSEKEALPAFTQLEQCTQNTEGVQLIQARLICFANASKLSQEFPELLGARFRQLATNNPKLVGMLQSTGL